MLVGIVEIEVRRGGKRECGSGVLLSVGHGSSVRSGADYDGLFGHVRLSMVTCGTGNKGREGWLWLVDEGVWTRR